MTFALMWIQLDVSKQQGRLGPIGIKLICNEKKIYYGIDRNRVLSRKVPVKH